jgi:hypothetical protein
LKGRIVAGKQVIGKNIVAGIPRLMATMLGLENPESYSGHSLNEIHVANKQHTILAPPPPAQHVTHNSFTFTFNGNITGNVTLQAANKNEEQK